MKVFLPTSLLLFLSSCFGIASASTAGDEKASPQLQPFSLDAAIILEGSFDDYCRAGMADFAKFNKKFTKTINEALMEHKEDLGYEHIAILEANLKTQCFDSVISGAPSKGRSGGDMETLASKNTWLMELKGVMVPSQNVEEEICAELKASYEQRDTSMTSGEWQPVGHQVAMETRMVGYYGGISAVTASALAKMHSKMSQSRQCVSSCPFQDDRFGFLDGVPSYLRRHRSLRVYDTRFNSLLDVDIKKQIVKQLEGSTTKEVSSQDVKELATNLKVSTLITKRFIYRRNYEDVMKCSQEISAIFKDYEETTELIEGLDVDLAYARALQLASEKYDGMADIIEERIAEIFKIELDEDDFDAGQPTRRRLHGKKGGCTTGVDGVSVFLFDPDTIISKTTADEIMEQSIAKLKIGYIKN